MEVLGNANTFFVAPNGSAQGDGTSVNPWSLAKALTQPAAVRPGAIIWMRGGTYTGMFRSDLQGTADAPITVRQMPGERATINGSLYIAEPWTTYWGFEITNSGIADNGIPTNAVSLFGAHTKLINLIIHDNRGSGIGMWADAPDSEVYGCLIYNNGISKFEHGIYVQNQTGVQHITDNVIFYQSGHGIHGYTAQGQFIQGLELKGNVGFANGWSSPYAANILVGGETPAARISVVNNYTYYASKQLNINIGYTQTTNQDVVIEGNYFVGGQPVLQVNRWNKASILSNTLISKNTMVGFTPITNNDISWNSNVYQHVGQANTFTVNTTSLPFAKWQQMTGFDTTSQYHTFQPTTPQIFVRPNQYESNRATLIVYNWPSQSAVDVDVSGVLPVGAHYEVRDTQNYFDTPIVEGKYNGTHISLPTTGLSAAAPSGDWIPSPLAIDPQFHAFILTYTQ